MTIEHCNFESILFTAVSNVHPSPMDVSRICHCINDMMCAYHVETVACTRCTMQFRFVALEQQQQQSSKSQNHLQFKYMCLCVYFSFIQFPLVLESFTITTDLQQRSSFDSSTAATTTIISRQWIESRMKRSLNETKWQENGCVTSNDPFAMGLCVSGHMKTSTINSNRQYSV